MHSRRNFTDKKNKWKRISIIFDFNFLSISYNYLLSNCRNDDVVNFVNDCSSSNVNKEASFIDINFQNQMSEDFFINFGLKKTDSIISPYVVLRYNL